MAIHIMEKMQAEAFAPWHYPAFSKKDVVTPEVATSEVVAPEYAAPVIPTVNPQEELDALTKAHEQQIADLKSAHQRELQQLFNIIHPPAKKIDETVLKALLELTQRLCQQILRRELSANPEDFIAILTEAKTLLPIVQEGFTLTLCESDFEKIRELLQAQQHDLANYVTSSAHLAPGDFTMQSGATKIDGKLATRIDNLISEHFEHEGSY